MCITVNHASLSKTKILSLPIENGNHFIAYSNSVKNLSGKPNAMILPIPGETNPSLFHNTEGYKNFLVEITKKCRLEEDYMGIRSRGLSKSKSLSFDQFELGQYVIALSKDFNGIREFLAQLPEEKRPVVSEELQNFFQEKYAGWSFAICTFDSDKTINAQPIAFEYKPFNYNFLYFPTMDGHDGGAPDVDAIVNTDHTFIFEHTGEMTGDYAQKFVTLDAQVPAFAQNRKYRAIHSQDRVKNGDVFINLENLSQLNFKDDPRLARVPPVPYVIA